MNNKNSRTFSLIKTLGSTALKAGTEAIQRKISSSAQNNEFVSQAAARLVTGLDELKGAAMKAGQFLSMFDEDTLPPGWKNVLKKLQAEATPKPFEEMLPLLKKELKNFNLIDSIDPNAVHAASIGQVHKAKLKDGSIVAIKIQYPDLDKNVKSDLENIKRLLKMTQLIPKVDNYEALFPTIEKIFLQEIDFEQERKFYNFYQNSFANEIAQGMMMIPRTIDELCSSKVLTTEWVQGKNIDTWMKENEVNIRTVPEWMEKRDELGKTLLKVIFKEILILQHVQSDPNPGNFLVTQEGKIIFLDFGATQKLSDNLCQGYRMLIKACLDYNERDILEASEFLTFTRPDDSQEIKDCFIEIINFAMEPAIVKRKYDWHQCHLSRKINEASFEFMKLTSFRAPPSELLFLNRRLLGNLLLMEKLGPYFDSRGLLQELLDEQEK